MLKAIALFRLSLLFGWPMTTKVPFANEFVHSEYDYIIVGGGTSGSVVASRLSEDPNQRILVLEAGSSDLDNLNIGLPSGLFNLFGTDIDWSYPIEPQSYTNEAVPNRGVPWPRGKVLGGSSSINGMVYVRGSPHDYDSWETHGATGWSWKEVEPYFQKFEGATDENMSERLGRNGPLKLTKKFPSKMHQHVADTAERLGLKKVDAHDDIEGVSLMSSTVHEGIRQSAATAFLHPILAQRKERLHIVLNAHVSKILLDHSSTRPKATGVVFTKNGQTTTVRARKEVILSAGVIGTPQLLLLSGIGPRNHLEHLKINAAVDLPGVGSNLQDHTMILFSYHATKMPPNFVTNRQLLQDTMTEYVVNGTGPWVTAFGADTTMNIRTGAGDSSASTSKHPFPDFQYGFIHAANETAGLVPLKLPNDKRSLSFIGAVCMAHPKSRGTVRLTSRDPFQYPAIDPNYLSNEDDMSLFIEGIRFWEKFETSDLFKEIGAELILPPFCEELHEQHPPRSEELYRCLLRSFMASEFHPCCTAKIGSPDDENAVVDPRLRVYGVENLRIADASVMPHLTSANIQAPCYMIGEKAADMIKEDWK